jgi:hypothetical protein
VPPDLLEEALVDSEWDRLVDADRDMDASLDGDDVDVNENDASV